MNELALFAGAGGGILGGHLLGWRTICAVEWEPYPASVLCARQNDGLLPPFPIWDDVQTFDGHPWRGIVDVVSGGFPCQDISAAGKGAGIDGERSGMWGEMARIIREVRPRFVFVENSPMLTSRGLGRVLGDLACMGFDARWAVLGAADVGANHQRDRIWIVARQRERISYPEHHGAGRGKQQQESPTRPHGKATYPASNRPQEQANECVMEGQGRGELQPSQPRNTDMVENAYGARVEEHGAFDSNSLVRPGEARASEERQKDGCNVAHAESAGQPPREDETPGRVGRPLEEQFGGSGIGASEWWQSEPDVGRVADGVAARVDRLKAIGNGQVPLCAATAWRVLTRDWIV
jgi:DNA (cytosine-5)-methyltransferase 1